jgi:large subunit ribosomal protein L33
MAKGEQRIKVKLRSTEGTGYTYMTTKNKATQRERITMKKYDPVIRRHVDFKEEK